MAPTKLQLFPRRVYHSSRSAGAIPGGVVSAIVVIIIIVFICVYIYEYRKAKRLQVEQNIPISKGKIFKNATLIALTFGLVAVLCAECFSDTNNGNTGSGGGNAQNYNAPPQMDQTGGGFVPPPIPSYQPQMDWTPIHSGVQDGVQG